jgi:hypothetical protein
MYREFPAAYLGRLSPGERYLVGQLRLLLNLGKVLGDALRAQAALLGAQAARLLGRRLFAADGGLARRCRGRLLLRRGGQGEVHARCGPVLSRLK